MFKNLFLVFLLFVMPTFAAAQNKTLNIVTTTETLAAIVKEIGGENVKVDFLSRGTEDPHYIEAKPSFMVKVRDADLVVLVGLDLEDAWMSLVLTGSRNPKVQPDGIGYLNLGQFVQPIGKISGTLDRSQGDVHPLGNPHYYLDPERVAELAFKISEKLADLAPDKKAFFQERATQFKAALVKKIADWKKRVQNTKIKNVITYHATFEYFLAAFQLNRVISLEPKPGIQPSASHIIEVIQKAKTDKAQCILNESHFETTAADRVAKELEIPVIKLPTEVGAVANTNNYSALIETLVLGIESCRDKAKQKAQI